MPRAQRKQLEQNEIIKYVYKSNDFIALQMLIFIAVGLQIRQSSGYTSALQMLILIAVGLQIRQSSGGVLSVFLKAK